MSEKGVPVIVLVSAAILAVAVQPASAEPRNEAGLFEAAVACAQEPDPKARLACYDAKMPAVIAARKSGDLVLTDRATTEQTKRALFGFRLPSLPLFKDDEAVRQIASTIVSLSSSAAGTHTFSLENGSRWRQKDKVYVTRPKLGETVTITRGRVGGFFAKVGDSRAFRVERLAE